LFGAGLVRTPGDFGTRGEPPTHPELLDWLATRFRGELQWSRKALIRLIVTSATYRQASRFRPEVESHDPRNLLLFRQNRFRVESEVLRDLNLAVAGLLSPRIGGPSVFPPLPADVAALSYANNFRWTTSTGEDRYRRGMYTFFKRTAPHPNLVTFDCPDGVTTAAARSPSNTPLQALATMNNEVFVETAQAFAARVLKANVSASDDARIDYAWQAALARRPSAKEREGVVSLLASARGHYRRHPDDAGKLVAAHRPENVPLEEAAAWVVAARVILNFDEFVTRE
jgi:hypothetical protein